jgi:hypothetical protein
MLCVVQLDLDLEKLVHQRDLSYSIMVSTGYLEVGGHNA